MPSAHLSMYLLTVFELYPLNDRSIFLDGIFLDKAGLTHLHQLSPTL